MKYPVKIREKISEIEDAVSDWPVEVDLNDVLRWILQFDNEDYDLALRIVKNLNVIGSKDLEQSLEVAYSKLMRKAIEKGTHISNRNTIFAGMGEDGKSGSMISYHFRLINELSEENFLNEESVKFFASGMIQNIVLIDDVLSSGTQASKEIHNITEKFLPLGIQNIFVLTVCGFRSGIKHVEEKTKAHVFSAFEYGEEDTVISLDSKFYEGIPHEQRKGILNRIEHYGSICARKMPLGYGKIGALLVFYYNTPNNTLPVIWGSQNGWIPLFRRVNRINGINSYYKQISNRQKSVAKENIIRKDELVIYTEGKIDEMIFDVLVTDFELESKLGFKKVSVVSIGGGYASKKLFEKLEELNGSMIFAFDFDIPSSSRRTYIEKLPIVYLKPSFLQFIDIETFINRDERFARFIKRSGVKVTPVEALGYDKIDDSKSKVIELNGNEYEIREIERYIKNRFISNNNIIKAKEILHSYFNTEGYSLFIEDAKIVLSNYKPKVDENQN